jgi:hypothetical protein
MQHFWHQLKVIRHRGRMRESLQDDKLRQVQEWIEGFAVLDFVENWWRGCSLALMADRHNEAAGREGFGIFANLYHGSTQDGKDGKQ